MGFDRARYGAEVQAILALDGNGESTNALRRWKTCHWLVSRLLSAWNAPRLFPDSFSPEAALSGLYLYFCALR